MTDQEQLTALRKPMRRVLENRRRDEYTLQMLMKVYHHLDYLPDLQTEYLTQNESVGNILSTFARIFPFHLETITCSWEEHGVDKDTMYLTAFEVSLHMSVYTANATEDDLLSVGEVVGYAAAAIGVAALAFTCGWVIAAATAGGTAITSVSGFMATRAGIAAANTIVSPTVTEIFSAGAAAATSCFVAAGKLDEFLAKRRARRELWAVYQQTTDLESKLKILDKIRNI